MWNTSWVLSHHLLSTFCRGKFSLTQSLPLMNFHLETLHPPISSLCKWVNYYYEIEKHLIWLWVIFLIVYLEDHLRRNSFCSCFSCSLDLVVKKLNLLCFTWQLLVLYLKQFWNHDIGHTSACFCSKESVCYCMTFRNKQFRTQTQCRTRNRYFLETKGFGSL